MRSADIGNAGVRAPCGLLFYALLNVSGAAFDKAYIDGQIKDHKATVALMQREIKSGADADAKAFATETSAL